MFSSPLFSILSLAAILVGSRDQRTQFWKGAIQESFQQNLVDIGSVVSEADSPTLHSRWPLLLKIEISSNGQHCPILSQNVPKFEHQNMPNLHNRYISAERKISQKNLEYMLNYSLPCSCS
jgi:hypothetical protein